MGSLSVPRLAPPRIAVALLIGAAAVSAVLGLCGCAGPAEHPQASTTEPAYGTLPSYLPKSSVTADRALNGSVAHPALTVEGDAVDVKLPGVTVRATVTGPVVPGEGLPYRQGSTTATLMVTLTGASSSIPLSLAQFRTVDHLGNVYTLQAVPGQAAIPTSVEPGHTVSFELRAFMVTGEGILQWAPDGTHPVATWDFVVEND